MKAAWCAVLLLLWLAACSDSSFVGVFTGQTREVGSCNYRDDGGVAWVIDAGGADDLELDPGDAGEVLINDIGFDGHQCLGLPLTVDGGSATTDGFLYLFSGELHTTTAEIDGGFTLENDRLEGAFTVEIFPPGMGLNLVCPEQWTGSFKRR